MYFLWEMLYESMYVPEGHEPLSRDILQDPHISKYMEGWGRKGDYGLVAISEGKPVGSITIRYLSEDNKGYGYVSDDIPELGMAISQNYRGQGIGSALLHRLFEDLRSKNVTKVSLSVDPNNRAAMKLYRKFGFHKVGMEGTSITMVANLNRNHAIEFIAISKHRMINHYLPKLKICLEQLNHTMIWHKESDDSNSIGGIVSHVIEHVNRNTLRLVNPDVILSQGFEDYFPDVDVDKVILLDKLEITFSRYAEAMDLLSADQLHMYNMYHVVEHTGYHLGQIIDRAQRITGIQFQFVQNGINEKQLMKMVEEEIG
ncbi:acetyltransferase [Paenibacillus pini JCM 16418]|uniref:Acetyltransferase n=2 Tax=Paenibacillus TaxID=44249 RepID=W7YNA7_9BACL|nr:acetyltransferase [Paenibacillus pini JCM 16418]